MSNLLYEDLTYKIIGAAKEVYKELGPGYLESVKAIKQITNQDEAQLINYLKTTRLRIGLLFNFGGDKFEMLRRVY
jgi:hypothetical protein